MKIPMTRLRVLLTSLVLTFSSAVASAGTISIDPGAGNLPTLLEPDAKAFTDAVAQALIDRTAGGPTPPARVFVALRSKVQGATIARIEYTFERDGVAMKRIYHARSGPSLQTMIEKAMRSSSTSQSGSESATGESSGGSDVAEADDIARDAAEARYYPADTDVDIRASKLPPVRNGVESSVVDAQDHSWDAELKAMRRMELDIREGTVTPGGRITGYVSKTVCQSCDAAIQRFAEINHIEGSIFHLVEPGSVTDAVGDDAKLIESSEALSREFVATRKNNAKAKLSREAYSRPREEASSALGAMERIEAEEASASLSTEGCAE